MASTEMGSKMREHGQAAGGVVTFGESMALVRATEIGSFAQVRDMQLGFGGAESNVAIGLARLGIPVTWMGRIGRDGFGRRIVRELLAERVGVAEILDPAAATGVMFKETPTPGATAVSYYRAGSAGSRISADDLVGLDIESAQLLHVTGITAALSDTAWAAVDAALDRARAAGVPVSFDVNHRSRLWADETFRERYASMLERSSIVFAGVEEALLLLNDETPESQDPHDPRYAEMLARRIADLGPDCVVVKLGDSGALSVTGGVMHSAPALPITPVDTVGAGDAFVAGWIAEWHAGNSPTARLETGNRSGALACLQPGDWESLPTRDQLEGLSRNSDPVQR